MRSADASAGALFTIGGGCDVVSTRAPGNVVGCEELIGAVVAIADCDGRAARGPDPIGAVFVTGIGAGTGDDEPACTGPDGVPDDDVIEPGCAGTDDVMPCGGSPPDCDVAGIGGGIVLPLRGVGGTAGGFDGGFARGGNCTPVGGAPRAARRGGNGGSLRPHVSQVALSSAFSALQNGQNLTGWPRTRSCRRRS